MDLEVVDTHLSTVYLVGDEAFKRKKPLRFAGKDYTSLEARFEACSREVRVNRRLAPGVYLGVVPIVGPDGEPVDWLVHMRRVDTNRSLQVALLEGWATPAHLEAVGEVLASFYEALPPRPVVDHARDLREASAAHDRALRAVGLDPSDLVLPVAAWIDAHPRLLEARGRRLVEGHGDLRAEHVLLTDPPVFIDALDLLDVRVDPLDELAYLALECERLGASWAREPLLAPWKRGSGDDPPRALLDLYQAFRAGLRASLYAQRVRDGSGDATDMRGRATAWLDAGRHHAAMLGGR